MERWQKNLYTLWVTQIISMISFGLGFPFIPYYIQDLGVTDPSAIKIYTGILSMAPAVTMAIMAPVWGYMADKYGRKLMILRAMFAAAIIIGLMGMATNVYHLIILRFLQGIFTGTITAASTFVASNTPKEKLSYALGFMSSSNFIGYSVGPIVGGIFAEHFGYRFSFLFGSAFMLVGFAIAWLVLVEDKSKIGLVKKEHKGKKASFKEIFSPMIVWFLAVLLLHRVTRSVFAPYIPLFVQSIIGTTKGAAQLTGFVNGAVGLSTAIAGIVIGKLGDRRNKLNMICVLAALGFGISLILPWINSIYVFMFVYGLMFFFIGGIEPIVTSTTAEHTDPQKRGVLFGVQGLVGSIGWMVSPLFGTAISVRYGVEKILYFIPVVILINGLIMLHIRNNYREKPIVELEE